MSRIKTFIAGRIPLRTRRDQEFCCETLPSRGHTGRVTADRRSGAAFGGLGVGLLPLSFCEAARRQTAGVSSAPHDTSAAIGQKFLIRDLAGYATPVSRITLRGSPIEMYRHRPGRITSTHLGRPRLGLVARAEQAGGPATLAGTCPKPLRDGFARACPHRHVFNELGSLGCSRRWRRKDPMSPRLSL